MKLTLQLFLTIVAIHVLQFLPGLAFGNVQDPIPFTTIIKDLDISHQLFHFEDTTNSLDVTSVNQLYKEGHFNQIDKPFKNWEKESFNQWFRLKFLNEVPSIQDWMLAVEYPPLDTVELYYLENNKWSKILLGGLTKASNRRFNNRFYIFPISVPYKNIKTFYLRVKTEGALHLPVKVYNPFYFYEINFNQEAPFFILYGIIIIMMIYNLIIYFSLKDKTYLYYVFFTGSLFIFFNSLHGHLYHYVVGEFPYISKFTNTISLSLIVTTSCLFARQFFGLTSKNKIWFYLMNTGIVVGLINIVLTPFLSTVSSLINGTLLMLIFSTIILVFSIRSVKKGEYSSTAFLIGWVAFYIGTFCLLLEKTGYLPFNSITSNLPGITTSTLVALLSIALINKFRLIKEEKERAQLKALELEIQTSENLDRKVKERTVELEKQKDIAETIQEELLSSINYAKGIQKSIMPPRSELKKYFKDGFLLFKPRDIVSGDFYWLYKTKDDIVLWTVADSTGHGVPGAFLSIIGNFLLNEVAVDKEINTTNKVLDSMRNSVIKALSNNSKPDKQLKDGMDMVFCAWDMKTNRLQFSGANNPLYLIRQNELIVYKTDRQPVGYHLGEATPFTAREIQLEKGDKIYLFSDGYYDQFGGEKGKKFKVTNFRKLLLSIQDKPMSEQLDELRTTLDWWMGDEAQIDDICVMGVEI